MEDCKAVAPEALCLPASVFAFFFGGLRLLFLQLGHLHAYKGIRLGWRHGGISGQRGFKSGLESFSMDR